MTFIVIVGLVILILALAYFSSNPEAEMREKMDRALQEEYLRLRPTFLLKKRNASWRKVTPEIFTRVKYAKGDCVLGLSKRFKLSQTTVRRIRNAHSFMNYLSNIDKETCARKQIASRN